jgi:hypothetical protein
MESLPAMPEKGFYYHYKHDPTGPVNNYAYEVMGVGMHTEDGCRPEDAYMVVYRPLYEARAWKIGRLFDLRPLEMWVGDVTKDGRTFPRFSRITDARTLEYLETIKQIMYEPQKGS